MGRQIENVFFFRPKIRFEISIEHAVSFFIIFFSRISILEKFLKFFDLDKII